MHVLIVETGSMLAQVIMRYFLEAGVNVLGTTSGKRDRNVISLEPQSPAFRNFLTTNRFDLVINCAAIGDPYALERQAEAVWVNSYLPHMLEKALVFSSTRVFQLSTARVFSGDAGPYTESSSPDSPWFLPRSRALGELRNEKDLTVRFDTFARPTCGRGWGALLWFMRQEREMRMASGVQFSPVSAPEVARCLLAAYRLGARGLWHLAPEEGTNAFALANMFAETLGRDMLVRDVAGTYSNRTLTNTRTDVPAVLNYSEMLRSLRSWMETHERLYAACMQNRF